MSILGRKGVLLAGATLVASVSILALMLQRQGERRLSLAIERFETEIGTLNPRSHTQPELPDVDNAAYWLKRGAAFLASLSESDRRVLNELWERDGNPGPVVENLLERHGDAVELLRRGGRHRASSWGLRYDSGVGDPMPDLLPHLWSKKILAAEARCGLSAGDRERVSSAAASLAALRRALEREPELVFQLVAMSVELAHHELIQQVLTSDLANEELLEELAGQLDVTSAGRTFRSALAVGVAQMIYSFEAELAGEGSTWQRLKNFPVRLWAPMEYAAAVDLYYDLAKATEMTVPGLRRRLRPEGAKTPGVRIVAQILIPNIVDGVEKSRASAATRRLADLAIKARLHALRNGAYPQRHELFLPGSEAMDDPYSGGTMEFTESSDGGIRLAYPDSDAMWMSEKSKAAHYRPRFIWSLPPLASAHR